MARMRSIAVRAAHSSERFEAKRERNVLPCSTGARAMTVIARELSRGCARGRRIIWVARVGGERPAWTSVGACCADSAI